MGLQPLGIERFRVSGDRLVMAHNASNETTGVEKAKLPFKERVVNFFKRGDARYGTDQQIQQNREFKTCFKQALEKATEGTDIAARALRKAGLPQGWEASAKPLTERQRNAVLDEAQKIRMSTVKQTNQDMKAFVTSDDGYPNFTAAFAEVSDEQGDSALPKTDLLNRDLQAAFYRAVRTHPDFGKKAFSPDDLMAIAKDTVRDFQAGKEAAFAKAYPGLQGLIDSQPGIAHADTRRIFVELRGAVATGHGRAMAGISSENEPFFQLVSSTIDAIEQTTVRMGKMAYSPEGWAALGNELMDSFNKLLDLETQLVSYNDDHALQTNVGGEFISALKAEVAHQKELLLAKAGFLDDIRTNDPLSQKTVAYSNLLWAHAAGKIIDQAIAEIELSGGEDAGNKISDLNQAKASLVATAEQAYNEASSERTIMPDDVKKSEHPASLGRAQTVEALGTVLTEAGLSPERIGELTSKKAMSSARQRALNENQDWAPVSRDIVVTREGVSQVYRSDITPGGSINDRFRRRYAEQTDQHDARQGVSSATKADHYHARNLKVSTLGRVESDGTVTGKATVIGHGVLDMWDIPDATERADANQRGAHEVLEAAISTNSRVRDTALARAASNNTQPVKITHVSVNLITPAGWRELPGLRDTSKLHDYQELTYTRAQFEAFRANTSEGNGGQPTTFTIDDNRTGVPQQQDVDIRVDVDVISFSFGINPLATGKLQAVLGGWDNVYAHNRTMMEKFVGDLGKGAEGSAGLRPSGFIGSVMERLDPAVPREAALLARMQEQTDLVRDMFTTEAFRTGNGDPAKMSRHILALQSMAEEALALKNVGDVAATMSKGCKSDKDRGGVTDVELKHLLITEDMGGHITPDTELGDEDQANYYAVASGSGQLENQRLNTGLAGSKEAGKLKDRIPDRDVRTYLKGLGAFASE